MTATSVQPTSLPMNLVVAFLTPILLVATGGDRSQATAMAVETINAHTARNPADLLLVGESIALGLGVLGSIGLSMAENIPIDQILRLRNNAASLHRAADRCRRAVARPGPIASGYEVEPRQELQTSTAATPTPTSPSTAAPSFLETLDFPGAPAAIEAAFAALVADAEGRLAHAGIAHAGTAIKAAGAPVPTPAPNPALMTEEEYYRACRAAGMADTANDTPAGTPILAPVERRPLGMRAAALNSTASHLIGNTPPPPG
jgi:hypothetical protein